MLRFLPGPCRAFIATASYLLLVFVLGLYIFALAPFKFMIPSKKWREFFTARYRQIPNYWNLVSNAIMAATSKVTWQIKNTASISKLRSYILISNHQSWMDILGIQKALTKIAPPSVYFMKRELLWFPPILGWGCYLMGFPFMRRYSKTYLEKHPGKKGLDIKSTQKTCEKYKRFPVTLISFPEGTRFTQEKHDKQNSPFKHLLKPRAGGLAHALNAMGEQVKQFIDVTIVYSKKNPTIWRIFSGKAHQIMIHIRSIDIPGHLRGDYTNDKDYRERFQHWLNQLWHEKDLEVR